MDIKKLVALAPIAALSFLTACGESNSSKLDPDVISCHVESDDSDFGESCFAAEEDTPDADSIKTFCKSLKNLADDNILKVEIGTGCPDKKATYTCELAGKKNYTHYYYTLNTNQKKRIVKNNKGETCKNFIADDKEFFEYVIYADTTELVSCYVYNVIDTETKEVQETCVETTADDKYAASIKKFCKEVKEALDPEDGDKIELGKGCPDSKVLYTCNEGHLSFEKDEDDVSILTHYYYTLSDDQKELVVKDDKSATCDKLMEFDKE